MFRKVLKSKLFKFIAVYLAINFVGELIFPSYLFALTGGPSQPEVQSFEPIGTSELVDIFSGDFTYNIPLMDVGGYPLNLSYHSGVNTDQEASWTGLGWNINAGAINRSLRGIPDDFQGDPITEEFNMRPNETYGVFSSLTGELFGFETKPGADENSTDDDFTGAGAKLTFGLGINFNNYEGVGFETTITPSYTSADKGKGTLTGSLGIKSASSGLSVSPNLSKQSGNRKEW